MSKQLVTRARQGGAVLVVGLIFLAVLSLLGVAAHSIGTQEERMSGNTRERVRAFQGAEASLRDCESLLQFDVAALPTFNGTGGAYTAAAADQPQVYETVNWKNDSAARVLANAPVEGVALQPRCIVEEVGDIERRVSDGRGGPGLRETMKVYRITATGFGASTATASTVQITFVRPQ